MLNGNVLAMKSLGKRSVADFAPTPHLRRRGVAMVVSITELVLEGAGNLLPKGAKIRVFLEEGQVLDMRREPWPQIPRPRFALLSRFILQEN